MPGKLLQPHMPVTDDGALDIEAINPYEESDLVVLHMTFEQFCEKITVLMLRHCPNRRVAHLVRYGRTQRVRVKNLVRLWMIELPTLLEVLS